VSPAAAAPSRWLDFGPGPGEVTSVRPVIPAAARILLFALALLAAGGVPARGADGQPGVPSVAFLGMAVAAGVGVNSQGLTDIQGIHAAIRAAALPVTENLQVYTRWTGGGTHVVRVQIRQASTGTVIGGATDELDFSADRVTYFTHDLGGTTFSAAGVYLVQAALDGTTVATYAIFVNTRDRMTDGPAFVLSVPAERGWLDENGTASVSGIFEYLSFPGFPATESFSIVTIWFSGSGDFDHSVRISDTNGTTVARSRHTMMTAAVGHMSISDDAFDSIAFPAAGLYTATLFLDGYEVTSYPLVIRAR
jgi:hypothetical protein